MAKIALGHQTSAQSLVDNISASYDKLINALNAQASNFNALIKKQVIVGNKTYLKKLVNTCKAQATYTKNRKKSMNSKFNADAKDFAYKE